MMLGAAKVAFIHKEVGGGGGVLALDGQFILVSGQLCGESAQWWVGRCQLPEELLSQDQAEYCW